MEIGKRGIWTQEQMQQQRPDIVYKVLAMDTICEQEPDRFNSLMVRLVKRRVFLFFYVSLGPLVSLVTWSSRKCM